MASSTAASIRKNKVGGIGANGKNHVAGILADGSIGMSEKIIKKHVAGLFGVFGWRGLVIGDFVQRNNDGGFTAAGIVEKESGNLLDSFDTEFIEEMRDFSGGELDFLAVDGSRPAMWGMLRLSGRGMLQGEEGLGHIARRGDVNVTARHRSAS